MAVFLNLQMKLRAELRVVRAPRRVPLPLPHNSVLLEAHHHPAHGQLIKLRDHGTEGHPPRSISLALWSDDDEERRRRRRRRRRR